MVFETFLTDRAELGSIASGGRYDDLVEKFSNESIPGVGGSIGLDRLLVYLEDREFGSSKKVLLPLEDESKKHALFRIAQKLRDVGIASEVYPEAHKIKRQFDYATRWSFSHLVFLNDDNTLRLRNALSREDISCSDIEALLRHLI
jgi:histidyl-tRNA synthetase